MNEISLNRKIVRSLYPNVDWDEYDLEVVRDHGRGRPECPSCDDEWAAHVAGLHADPPPVTCRCGGRQPECGHGGRS